LTGQSAELRSFVRMSVVAQEKEVDFKTARSLGSRFSRQPRGPQTFPQVGPRPHAATPGRSRLEEGAGATPFLVFPRPYFMSPSAIFRRTRASKPFHVILASVSGTCYSRSGSRAHGKNRSTASRSAQATLVGRRSLLSRRLEGGSDPDIDLSVFRHCCPDTLRIVYTKYRL
jgi:hypothetical protein